jgi:hypothetical protein
VANGPLAREFFHKPIAVQDARRVARINLPDLKRWGNSEDIGV